MALTNEQLVHQMYIAYYQRPADPDGLAYWVNQIEENGSWEAVAGAFGAPENEEYQGLYGDKSRADLVAELYQSAFGRVAVQEEIDFWVASEHSDMNLGFAIISGAQNDDKALIENKVAFSELLAAEVDQAGYVALTDVKAALAAVTAETNVADAVADLVTEPSELAGLLAAVTAAENAKTAFLKSAGEALKLEGDDGKPVSAEVGDVTEALNGAKKALTDNTFAENAKFDAGESETLQASKLNTAKLNAAEAIADAQEKLDDANEAAGKVAGLLAANAQFEASVKAKEDADKAEVSARATLNAADASYETLFGEATPAVTLDDDDKPVVNPAITNEAQKAEAGKVLVATVAHNSAIAAAAAAAAAEQEAENNLAFIDTAKGQKDTLFDALNPESTNTTVGRGDALTWAEAKTALAVAKGEADAGEDGAADALAALQALVNGVLATDNVRVDTLNNAEEALEDAEEAQEELLELIAKYDAAVKMNDDLEALETAIEEAKEAIDEAGYEVISVNALAHVATAEDDVFLVGETSATIYNFGVVGNDQLFIGEKFTLNTGALKDGNNSVLEVFFIQNGNDTDVTLETKAYGSSEAGIPEVVITLSGVNAADLTLTDEGFVAVA